jgi:adenosylcobinamide-GDP ribazoletransferase
MRNLFAALRFITILPLGKQKNFDPRGMVPFFPIIGLLLGAMVSLFDLAATRLWPLPVSALLDVLFLLFLTGAFHLDGLGDTADGLYGHRQKEAALAIMKDSRIGVMGLLAIIAGLSVKWAGIANLHINRNFFLLIIPAYARASMLFGMYYLEYGRPDGGTGKPFFENKIKPTAFWGLLIPIIITMFMGWQGIIINIAFALLVVIILVYYKRKMNCITGDMLGAMTEITESVLFLVASARWYA